jgi:hypothetical protein
MDVNSAQVGCGFGEYDRCLHLADPTRTLHRLIQTFNNISKNFVLKSADRSTDRKVIQRDVVAALEALKICSVLQG